MIRERIELNRRSFDKFLTGVGVLLVILLALGGAIGLVAHNFTVNQIRTQLVDEKIFFPKAGDPALDPQKFPDLQKYAGQQVDNGAKAEAFANGYIKVHLDKASGNRSYSEVSAAQKANPNDPALVTLKTTMAQGDALRTSLLTIYGFSRFGDFALWAAWTFFAGAGVMLLLVLGGIYQLRRPRSEGGKI